MELKALNEFRIGNYYRRKLGCGSIYKKISLNLLSRILSEDISIAFNDFEAIDLTEDWLINLGFKKTNRASRKGEISGFTDGSRYTVLRLLKSEKRLWAFMFDDIEIRNITHVHDFQNIYFALTKKELELAGSLAQ